MSWSPNPYVFERQLDAKLTRKAGIPDRAHDQDMLVAVFQNLGIVLWNGQVYVRLISECRVRNT